MNTRLTLAGLLCALHLAAQPRLTLPLAEPHSVSIAVGRGTSCRLMFRKGETRLTALCGASSQDIAIPILQVPGDPVSDARILVDDFDFDGYLDLMIPIATGYGGVNWFYDLLRYHPASRSFRPLPDASQADFCNPETRPAEQLLRTPCKDGPAWFDDAYKFSSGQPYQYRATELVQLNGFPDEDSALYAHTYFNARQQVLRRTVRDAVNDQPTATRRLPFEKSYLHRTPAAPARTSAFLVKGDTIQILEVREDAGLQWLRVSCQRAPSQQLTGWLLLPPA